jgi:hypothetical protein
MTGVQSSLGFNLMVVTKEPLKAGCEIGKREIINILKYYIQKTIFKPTSV